MKTFKTSEEAIDYLHKLKNDMIKPSNPLTELIREAVIELGRTQCDCGCDIEPENYVTIEDVEKWLESKKMEV